MAGRIAAGRGLAITYKMQVQQPTKTFCNFMQKRLAKNSVAACLEEHFPHSMAKAVVDAASKKGLSHEEMHTKVEYIVVEIMTEL